MLCQHPVQKITITNTKCVILPNWISFFMTTPDKSKPKKFDVNFFQFTIFVINFLKKMVNNNYKAFFPQLVSSFVFLREGKGYIFCVGSTNDISSPRFAQQMMERNKKDHPNHLNSSRYDSNTNANTKTKMEKIPI